MAPELKAPPCERCGSTNVKLRRQIIGSGAVQIAWWCTVCKRWAQRVPRWLPHAYVTLALSALKPARTIEDIPVVSDYSETSPCIICGGPSESHHWAPRALSDAFGDDWDKWPQAPLCVRHHRMWHDIVTPNLGKHRE
jgi:hypothetical protein